MELDEREDQKNEEEKAASPVADDVQRDLPAGQVGWLFSG